MTKKQIKKILKKKKRVIVIATLSVVIVMGLLMVFKDDLILLKTKLVTDDYPLASSELMQTIKSKGCVYDGLLTPRYNAQFNASVEMLERSQCKYIHRAIETWNIPPNFTEIERRINVINKKTGKKFIYSMFIAESIDFTKGYYDPLKKKYFNFRAMCSPGTYNSWGANTCKPSIEKREYRSYVISIMKRAVDLGIEDFTFGQIYYQDPNWKKNPFLIRGIIAEVKNYAISKGKEISIGAQTNTMDNEEYLRNFDYITGGIGQNEHGEIETGEPCWSYYYNRSGYCWALLWHEKYKTKANNILVYLDWNNSSTDDIHRFIRMDRESRGKFLGKAYDFFLQQDIGFLSPLGTVLGNVGGSCYGPTREFYSASNKYSCKDEDTINDVFLGKKPLPNYNKFIEQAVPTRMEVGKKYSVRIKMKNTSFRDWNKDGNFQLGSWAAPNNITWGIKRVELAENEIIAHNETKEFTFEVTAPSQPGEYVFQWRMLEEGVEWFGDENSKIAITVEKVINDNNNNSNQYPAPNPKKQERGNETKSILESI